jgi:hypothetical protein
MKILPAAGAALALLGLLAGASWLLLRPSPVDPQDEPLLRRALQDGARVEHVPPDTLRRARWVRVAHRGRVDCVELRTSRSGAATGSRFCYERATGKLLEERLMAGF